MKTLIAAIFCLNSFFVLADGENQGSTQENPNTEAKTPAAVTKRIYVARSSSTGLQRVNLRAPTSRVSTPVSAPSGYTNIVRRISTRSR